MPEEIVIDRRTCAIILRSGLNEPGIRFHTPNKLSQQLASMNYRAGKKIGAHTHNEVPREVFYTQETLFVRKGRIRVDFFRDDHTYYSSRILASGDVILLIAGGHGFEVLDDLDMIEVKQGPYVGEEDKTRFEGILPQQLNFGMGDDTCQ